MNAANCIGIYLSAKARNCRELALSATIINLKNLCYSNISIILGAKLFAFEHFRNVVHESEEYLQLPYIELKNILESQLLNTAGEGEILETITKWVDYKPNECVRDRHLAGTTVPIYTRIGVFIIFLLSQVPAEKLLAFVNSDILSKRLRDSGFSPESSVLSEPIFGGDFKLAVERILSQRCHSPCSKTQPHYTTSTLVRNFFLLVT